MPSGTILLVDDDDSIRQVIRAMLELHGYRVIDVGAPALAQILFEHDPAAIDLLITDMRMPGISGRILADRLAVTRPELPVLFSSGSVEAMRSVDGNNRAVLAKPFAGALLLEALGTLLTMAGR
jgi:CheY-like chemotaxis protein